jgi:hypothetical protein
MAETAKSQKKRPSHIAFMVEGDGENAKWSEVGAMWPHAKGKGFNLILKAMPINGKVVIIERDANAGAGQ